MKRLVMVGFKPGRKTDKTPYVKTAYCGGSSAACKKLCKIISGDISKSIKKSEK